MEQQYNFIYVVSVSLPRFGNLIKIGQATVMSANDLTNIADNDKMIKQTVSKKLDQSLKLTGINYQLEYCTLAINHKTHQAFSDLDIYNYLQSKGILPAKPSSKNGWYNLTVKEAIEAIKTVKNQ